MLTSLCPTPARFKNDKVRAYFLYIHRWHPVHVRLKQRRFSRVASEARIYARGEWQLCCSCGCGRPTKRRPFFYWRLNGNNRDGLFRKCNGGSVAYIISSVTDDLPAPPVPVMPSTGRRVFDFTCRLLFPFTLFSALEIKHEICLISPSILQVSALF